MLSSKRTAPALSISVFVLTLLVVAGVASLITWRSSFFGPAASPNLPVPPTTATTSSLQLATPAATTTATTTVRLFYVQSDNTRIRDCAALTCNIIGYYSANTPVALPYNSTSELPEWVQVTLPGSQGNLVPAYLKATTLGTTQVATSAPSVRNPARVPATVGKSSLDLPTLVKEWTPRVVKIVCMNNNFVSNGSGVLTKEDFSRVASLPSNNPLDLALVVTNKHVVTDSTTGFLREVDPKNQTTG